MPYSVRPIERAGFALNISRSSGSLSPASRYELMEEAGLETPPVGRTLESICIVEACSPDYDPVEIN